MVKLRVIINISFLFLTCCSYQHKDNLKEVTLKSKDYFVKLNKDDIMFNKVNSDFEITVINKVKWNKILKLYKPIIEVKYENTTDLRAYPVFVLNSSINEDYYYPIDSKGKIFFGNDKKIIVSKNR